MERRHFLTNVSVGAVATGMSLTGHASVARRDSRLTFVFVHGAWHGGWCWSNVISLLARQGVQGITLDLPGHGLSAQFPAAYAPGAPNAGGLSTEISPLASISLADYRDHVLAIIRGLVSEGRGPVVLVGHSLGGVTLNAVAEAEPSLVKKLVYLTAFVPVAEPTVLDYLQQPNFVGSGLPPLFYGDPSKLGAARINPNSGDATYVARVRDALYSDVPPSVLSATLNMLTPDEPIRGLSDPATVSPGHWGTVPRTFIRCTRDNAIPLAAQDQMIAEANRLTPYNPFRVETLDSSHSSFLSRPAELADLLLEAAQ
ncbi:esterase [Caballeronia temeraria]|uniref:Esterase n=1 Tax=Caballeronia temeraria TaxID=1777137 RepID=A0A158DVY9_9BURK|nr:esterase [Caballeronia temeraria]